MGKSKSESGPSRTVGDYIQPGFKVVDCGCYGWRLADLCRSKKAQLIGVDRTEPPEKPSDVDFASMQGVNIHLDDDLEHMVVANHIIEHLQDPVSFMVELVRITRPDGMIWIEAPSELSALTPGTDDPSDHKFSNFWDDPTHVRPWTPGALYRLALTCACIPVMIDRSDADGLPTSRMLARKPSDCHGAPETRYVTLREVPSGFLNAWHHVWGQNPIVNHPDR